MDKEKTLRKLKQEIEEVQKKHGVDPLELVGVVRCKDCKLRETCRTTNIWAVPPGDEWYCADGERREQNA